MSQGLEKVDEIIPNTAMKKANEGYRKGGKILNNSEDPRLSHAKFKIRESRCCAAVKGSNMNNNNNNNAINFINI